MISWEIHQRSRWNAGISKAFHGCFCPKPWDDPQGLAIRLEVELEVDRKDIYQYH